MMVAVPLYHTVIESVDTFLAARSLEMLELPCAGSTVTIIKKKRQLLLLDDFHPQYHKIRTARGDPQHEGWIQKDSEDGPALHNFVVTHYFVDSLDNLWEATANIIDLLDDDLPDVIRDAMEDPAFQSILQEYYRSGDTKEDRNLKIFCRRETCNLLTHCVERNFHCCVKVLF